ncbi:DNA translocase FtsK [candidate division LCP-89 bacterium B3_LCP]|uniref:DNA translocase FtsK n=1 Tax=candidate division LCP-89 bacterium B3_LCP TaxID=2012998 RepID=A0A532UZK9_UNCL8|nr:MAG: DNA translocase FtsK [candidate division LCP-89 bacterium B3_LCP]
MGENIMKKTAQKRRSKKKQNDRGRLAEILGLFLLFIALLCSLALISYKGEPELSRNLLGEYGANFSHVLINITFGRWPTFVFPLLLLYWAGVVLFRWNKLHTWLYSIALVFIAFWTSFTIGLIETPDPISEHAGWIGVETANWITKFMGTIGSWIIWSFIVLVLLVFFLHISPSEIIKRLISGIKQGGIWLWNHRPKRRLKFKIHRRRVATDGGGENQRRDSADSDLEDDALITEDLFPQKPAPTGTPPADMETEKPIGPQGEYQRPPLNILDDQPPESPDAPEELKAKAQRLQEALSDFGVGARVVRVNPGPVITRFDLEPDPGVKVSRISNLADDLALVLRARAIRIQAPIPGQGAVGVEIPNRRPSIVALKSVAADPSFQDHKSPLAVALGVTAAGDPYVSDLASMPHLLVAGTTGSGKSVCLNAIIASLLLRNPPERLQFVIIDPKKLELSTYARLARHHLLASMELDEEVITTPANAVRVLGGVELEMARRYDLMAGVGVRNIVEFNELAAKGKAVSPDGEVQKTLSFLIVVIDELADLMMIAAKDVEEPIARLAQMARAVGIHLIVATQRPSVDVITGVIKANFPARLAFQVASKTDSRTILDMNGAETLLGNGDALFIPPGRGLAERIHCCNIGHSEIEGIISFVEDQPHDFHRTALRLPRLEGIIGGDTEELGDRDELFDDAARIVIHQGQASVSVLQRRLKIGYARAGRLIDQLERAGVVGPFDGSKAREVLMDEDDLEAFTGDLPPTSTDTDNNR